MKYKVFADTPPGCARTYSLVNTVAANTSQGDNIGGGAGAGDEIIYIEVETSRCDASQVSYDYPASCGGSHQTGMASCCDDFDV